MSRTIRLINGKGDWTATPPTGASDADLYQLANDIIAQGGVVDLDGGDALVTQSSTPGMSVKIAKGTIYVENAAWTEDSFEPKYYQVVANADEDVSIDSNSSGSTRIDLICQQIDKITAPNDDATNVCDVVVVKGTPGAGAPALPSNHELLATVTVDDGATSILNADISDDRRKVFILPNTTNGGFVTLVDGATVAIDCENGKYDRFVVTIAGNRTLTIDNLPEGMPILLYVIQGSGGTRTLTFPTYISDDGSDLEFATAVGAIDGFVIVKLPSGSLSVVKVAENQS